MEIVKLSHGNGGLDTQNLINDVFYKNFSNEYLAQKADGTNIDTISGEIIVTTDSFVVSPIVFNGGDIGKLSVCGTINDLSVSGAKPLYITVAFIIEEGFPISTLKDIAQSIANEATYNQVKIIAGDTKVVERGKCDGVYINTTGIGVKNSTNLNMYGKLKSGDKIIINGDIADHGISLLMSRKLLDIDGEIKSDCCSLMKIIDSVVSQTSSIKVMRDATRGGLATTLKELSSFYKLSFNIYENNLPIKCEVNEICEMVGFDPLYIANEGKCIFIVGKDEAEKVVNIINLYPNQNARIIGEVLEEDLGNLYLTTRFGSKRILDLGEGEMLPRIC